MIKAIVHERIPNKVHCQYPPSDPFNRAKDEFNRYYEAATAAFSFAVKSGKWSRIENLFQHNLWLLDTFSVHAKVEAKKFLQDYAELLSRTNRTDESRKMLERAKSILW